MRKAGGCGDSRRAPRGFRLDGGRIEAMSAFAGCSSDAKAKESARENKANGLLKSGTSATDARRQDDTRCWQVTAFRGQVMQFGTRQIKIGGLKKNLGGSFGKTSGPGRNTAV